MPMGKVIEYALGLPLLLSEHLLPKRGELLAKTSVSDAAPRSITELRVNYICELVYSVIQSI